jgi:hypothetical protein
MRSVYSAATGAAASKARQAQTEPLIMRLAIEFGINAVGASFFSDIARIFAH